MFVIENGREHFFQWDTGQRLIINDNTVVEVHFCNRTDDCSLVCEVYTDGGKRFADVPNILLQNDWQIRVYAFCGNYTKVEKRLDVVRRSKPADYVYTETEVKNWNALEDRVNNTLSSIERLGVEVASAETQRETAEAERKTAETNRKEAEAQRETAEAARDAAFNTAMNEWETEVNTTVNDANTDVAAAVANAEAAANAANDAISMLLDNAHAAAIVCENTAGIVSINDAAACYAVGATTHFAAKQEGSGDASPTNIRPIVGYDTATITRTGKNLLGFNDYTTSSYAYNDTCVNGVFRREVKEFVKTSYVIGSTGLNSIINPNIKAGTYTFAYKRRAGAVSYDNPYLEITLNDGAIVNLQNGVETTITQDGTITGMRMTMKDFYAGDIIEFIIQLEAGAGTKYEQYNGTALTAEMPDTVYGGSFDWNTGMLTITHSAQVLNGKEEWIKSSSGIYQLIDSVLHNKTETVNTTAKEICSHFKATPHTTTPEDNTLYELNNNRLCIRCDTAATLEEWKAYLAEQNAAGTPVTIVWELMPTEYTTIQLTPQQLQMLKGNNNVFSESGETALTYNADTKLYIDNKIAALQNAVLSLGGNI